MCVCMWGGDDTKLEIDLRDSEDCQLAITMTKIQLERRKDGSP